MIAPLKVEFHANGNAYAMTWHEGAGMWSIQSTSLTGGGSVDWRATPAEMSQWVISRKLMSLWATAHYNASEARARAIADAPRIKLKGRIGGFQ